MKHLMLALPALAFIANSACTTAPSALPVNTRTRDVSDSPAFKHPGTPLAPTATLYTGITPPIVRQIEPRSSAQKAGIQIGDQLVRLNGKKYFNALEFERQLKIAPKNSSITLKRGEGFKMMPVTLGDSNPRLGVSFEPEATPLKRKNSPFIAYMHVKDVTVYAETSLNDLKKELHVNFIVKSDRIIPTANMNYSIAEKGQSLLGRGSDRLDALGSTPHLITKVFKKEGDLKGPLLVSLNVDKRHFQFEFH